MVMFKIGANDYSNRVIAGSYKINSEDVVKIWTDIEGVEHSEPIRERVVGSFEMIFKTMEEYEEFYEVYKNARNPDTSVRIAICDNKTNEVKIIDARLTFSLTRNRDGSWNDVYERFKMNIREK